MNMKEFASIEKGDAIKIKVGTTSGYVQGWRIVRKKYTSYVEIRAQGADEFIVRPDEISAVIKKNNVIAFKEGQTAERSIRAAARELFTALEWITRCAHIRGPLGTRAYIIKDSVMADAIKAVKLAKGEA